MGIWIPYWRRWPGPRGEHRGGHYEPETSSGSALLSEALWVRAHFSASPPLLVFINNIYLVNLSLDYAFYGGGGGVHLLGDAQGWGRGIDLHGVVCIPPGATYIWVVGIGRLPLNNCTGLPHSHHIFRLCAPRLGCLFLCCVTYILFGR